MCGIFATTESAVWEHKLDAVRQVLDHRGPDDSGWLRSEHVLLLHTRLAIIGLGEPGRQPAISSSGDVALVFNGEIYNYRELAASRGIRGETSDTRVLRAIIAERRLDSLADLRGMYAFAAWDAQEQSLLAMRDPFGIKPLYLLQHRSGGITVSSEITALLLCPEARDVDPLGIAHFLAVGHTSPVVTAFSRIKKLDPGSLYIWRRSDSGGYCLRIQRPIQPDAWNLSLHSALEDSVKAHLTSDVEVGGFMSSGTDSTLLCALASRHLPGMRTYTISFPESPEIDESELAKQNAQAIGSRHAVVPVHEVDMASCLADVVRIHGEPFGDAAVLPLTLLARRAVEDVKVVLCGEGADEMFGGYRRYRVSRRLGRVTRAVSVITKRLAERWSVTRGTQAWARSIEALLWGGGIRSHVALLDADLTLVNILNRSLHDSVLHLLQGEWERVVTHGTSLSHAVAYDRLCWLPNTYLEKTDMSTMIWGLEARVPYLDGPLSRVARPERSDTSKKTQLRAELASVAPKVRLPHRKLGLAVNIPKLLRFPQLADPIRFELTSNEALLARWLEPSSVSAFEQRAKRSATFAFRLATLGIWDEEFSPCSPA